MFWTQIGVDPRIAHWAGLAGVKVSQTAVDSYVAAVGGTVNAETVATQKYIHFYMQGTEVWAEYRRTGFPKTLLKPEEYSYSKSGSLIKFSTLSETKGDLPARVK